jgi:lipoate-protein ligase B
MKRRFYGWKLHLGIRPYKATLEWQKRMVRYRGNGTIRDTLMFLQHPHTITVGRDIKKDSLKGLDGVEVHYISRGGDVTYHGPGQLVVYPIIDLKRQGKDLHKFIRSVEQGIIAAFASYGLGCDRNPEHTGVWIGERKIASIGIAVRNWISYHGAAINLTTDLERFQAIRPCGLSPEVMTSALRELGVEITPVEFADTLALTFGEIFDTDFQEVDLEQLAEEAYLEESSRSL